MDILYFLKSDFDEIKSLIHSLEQSGGPSSDSGLNTEDRHKARTPLGLALRLYLILKRDYIYPEIKGLSPSLDALVALGQKRIQGIESLLGGTFLGQGESIRDLDEKSFTQLLALLKEHIALEEQFLMPKIRLQMRTEDREDLGQVLADVKDEILAASAHRRVPLKQPEPSAVLPRTSAETSL